MPLLAWTIVDGLAGMIVGVVAGLLVALASRRFAPAATPLDPSLRRERLRAALAADPRLATLAAPSPDEARKRVEAAWDKGWRDSLVERCVVADERFVDALVTTPSLRTAVARLVHLVAEGPDGTATWRTALVPVARALPLRSLLPADPVLRRDLIRTAYERLARDEVIRTLATLDLRQHLRARDLVAIMDDDLLRRVTAQLLRLFARDKERLRQLHAAIVSAYGDQTLLSVGPFQLSVGDLLRRFVTVASVQDQLARGSNLLEKPMDAKLRQVRDAGVDAALGWLDAWQALAPEQRQRAVTALHARVWPLVLPIVDEALQVALATRTLGDVVDALPDAELASWLRTVATAIEAAQPSDEALQTLSRGALAAWRQLPEDDRRAFARTTVDAFGPPAKALLGEWFTQPATSANVFAVDADRLAELVFALDADAPPPSPDSRFHWVSAITGGLAGLLASFT